MKENNKFYYLKLNESFFGTEEIKIIEDLPDGVIYSNLLLKLYLLSIKSKGILRFGEYEFMDENLDSKIKNSDAVKKDLKALAVFGFIEKIEEEKSHNIDLQKLTEKKGSSDKLDQGNVPEEEGIKFKDIEQREVDESINFDDSAIRLKNYFEIITGGIWSLNLQTLKKAVKKHGYENVKSAVNTAVNDNEWTMAYVNRILREWMVKGYPHEKESVEDFIEPEKAETLGK